LISDVAAVVARHDPAAWVRPLRYRPKRELPYDPAAVPPDASLLLDTTVYIDQLKGHLPAALVALISSRVIVHGAPVLAELAVTVGVLDPLEPILDTLRHIPPQRIVTPSEEAWLEGAVLAGILGRTQGIAKEHRRKFLNDVLMFLLAAEVDAILVSRNAHDVDLLLQMKPGAGVLLYERA
jgi:predicted nucleic acid-binding protein